MSNKLLLIGFAASAFTVIFFYSAYTKSQKPAPSPSPSPLSAPYYQGESFQKARDKVILRLPYIKNGITIEYFAGAQAIQATIEAASTQDYRTKKREAEKFLTSLGVNICDLHVGWVPRGEFKKDLIQGDVTTGAC